LRSIDERRKLFEDCPRCGFRFAKFKPKIERFHST
jgi:hypothetical protein